MPALEVPERTVNAQASFAFGETHIRFESTDSLWLDYLGRRYGSFSVPSRENAFVLRFEPTAPSPAGLVSPLAPRLEAVECEASANGYRVQTETTDCEIDLGSRRAILRGPSAMYPLDNVLRHLLPLLWEDGLILHSALIADSDGASVLACGPSGAGKSTIARLARGRALSDELAAIRLAGGEAQAIALPFWEAHPGSARLNAVLHLRHAKSHRLEPVRAGESLRKLASQVLWPVWGQAAMARSFAYLAQLSEAVPAFDLSFAPTEDVWKLIDEEVS